MTKPGPLSPEDQLDVLSMIWGDGEKGYVFLPWIPGSARTDDARRVGWRESRAFEWPDDREDILKHLHDHDGDELYFTPNRFLQESRVRQAVAEETTLWADLDEVDPITDIDTGMSPSIAWESSPGRFQAIWLMDSMYIGASEGNGPNHRLTAAIGADKSGWDTTQLLRVPGRPNHKPKYRAANDGEPVPGRLLWARANKIYGWQKFIDLPEAQAFDLSGEDVEESDLDGIDRHEVWARVRLKCSHTVRQYMAMRSRDITKEFDRSEVLWQIERDLADAGCTIHEIIAVVRATAWNKHAGRSNELVQLRSEAIKAKQIAAQDEEEGTPLEAADNGLRPKTPIWLSTVIENPIPRPHWLVHNIWAKGTCGFIAAEPKSYKSYFALDMAVSIATGTPFLNDPQFGTREAPVLYLQEEDALPLVMYRLAQILEKKAPDRFWHGQLERGVSSPHTTGVGASADEPELFWVPPTSPVPVALHVRTGFVASDPAWQGWLADFVDEHKFSLVIIDTLGTTLGDLSVTDDRLYPRVLNPLKEISNATRCGIAIVHHNRKSSDDKARRGQMMSGSGSFHAWVESALYLHKGEHVSGKPATIFVERENKLAQDHKFRVKIPTMWEGNFSDESEQGRQLWEPEVALGWGESDASPEVAEAHKTTDTKGLKATNALKRLGMKGGKYITTDNYMEIEGIAPQQRHSVIRQMAEAVAKGWVDGSDDEGWTLR